MALDSRAILLMGEAGKAGDQTAENRYTADYLASQAEALEGDATQLRFPR